MYLSKPNTNINMRNGSIHLKQKFDVCSLISCREGMMSYKQFIQELEDDILPAEAERRYVM